MNNEENKKEEKNPGVSAATEFTKAFESIGSIMNHLRTRNPEIIMASRKIYDVKADKDVSISGAIDSPKRWLKSREETFNKLESHALVDYDNRSINLVINETNSNGEYYQINGQIQLSEKFTDLGINSSCQSYSPVELANKLKLLRSIFPQKGDHAIIVNTLRNLKAKINKAMEQTDDRRGNTSNSFEQTVESNMPESFKICIPLIKGANPIEIELSVILEAKSGEIRCFLESVEAAEKIDEISEKLISEEVEAIEELTTVIFK